MISPRCRSIIRQCWRRTRAPILIACVVACPTLSSRCMQRGRRFRWVPLRFCHGQALWSCSSMAPPPTRALTLPIRHCRQRHRSLFIRRLCSHRPPLSCHAMSRHRLLCANRRTSATTTTTMTTPNWMAARLQANVDHCWLLRRNVHRRRHRTTRAVCHGKTQ